MSFSLTADVALAPVSTATSSGASRGGTDKSSTTEARPRPAPIPVAPSQVDAFLQAHNQSVRFQIDQQSGLTIVHIVDAATGETVRQIPNEVVVRVAQYLRSQCDGDCPTVDVSA